MNRFYRWHAFNFLNVHTYIETKWDHVANTIHLTFLQEKLCNSNFVYSRRFSVSTTLCILKCSFSCSFHFRKMPCRSKKTTRKWKLVEFLRGTISATRDFVDKNWKQHKTSRELRDNNSSISINNNNIINNNNNNSSKAKKT